MLQHLLIKDLAIMAFADIDFLTGMTVVTGETGAGKSIILDALQLLLGARADSQLIRPGAPKAEIIATFDISALPGAVLWLAEGALISDCRTQCIVRRTLFPHGRNRSFINGIPVTIQQLRLLGEYLIQLHGQHQHQLLLKSNEQLRLLDAFGQHETLVSQVKTIAHSITSLAKRKKALLESLEKENAHATLLLYQIDELEALQITEQELPTLYEEHDLLANAQQTQIIYEQVHALLKEEEDSVSVRLYKALQLLSPKSLPSKAINNLKKCLENAKIHLDEAIFEVNKLIQNVQLNPERLYDIEQRLAQIYAVARKHKTDPLQLYTHYQKLLSQKQACTALQEAITALNQESTIAKKKYQSVADQLSKARLQAAHKLSKLVTETISHLGMKGALFSVTLLPHTEKETITAPSHGQETVLFCISANPGHPPESLAKVASGGELSRLSLALELVIYPYLTTSCLLFDEVDVGISGKIGALVGKALYNLSKNVQVICITHLPQVAAFGDHHLQVIKTQSQHHTEAQIHVLTDTQRVDAIARLLGGMHVTQQARAQAKALLKEKTTSTTIASA